MHVTIFLALGSMKQLNMLLLNILLLNKIPTYRYPHLGYLLYDLLPLALSIGSILISKFLILKLIRMR